MTTLPRTDFGTENPETWLIGSVSKSRYAVERFDMVGV
jgi:hypothetical protein